MKKKYVILMLIGLLTIPGCGNSKANTQQTEEVSTTIEETSGIEAWGEVIAQKQKEIVIDFPVTVKSILVKEGDSVKKGDILFNLDYTDYKNQIAQKEKELELEKAKLDGIVKNTSVESQEVKDLKDKQAHKESLLKGNSDPEIKLLQSDIKKYTAELEKAKQEYTNQKQLFAVGALSQKQLDQYKEVVEDKEKAIEDKQYLLEKVKLQKQNEIKELEDSIDQKNTKLAVDTTGEVGTVNTQKLKIEMTALQLEQLKSKLNVSTIKNQNLIADIERGTVTSIKCKEGSKIGENGSQVVIELLDNSTLVVRADVPEEFVTSVAIGDKAEVVPYADKTKTLVGKVINIANNAVKENGETIIKVDIALDDKTDLLKAGFSVDVKILE